MLCTHLEPVNEYETITFDETAEFDAMTIPDEIIRRARTGDRQAVDALLRLVCPAVWRIACGLTGSRRAGSTVARTVLRQSVRVMADWREGITPENWFYHHTVLATRSAAGFDGEADVLEPGETDRSIADRAFVLSMRGLPRQQREAFILHVGERLNTRLLGITMDCSASAAEVHLDAAMLALRSLAGERFDRMSSQIVAAYASLAPSQETIAQIVRREAGKGRRVTGSTAFVRRIAFLIILMSIALAGWHWRGRLLQWFQTLQRLDAPATRPTGSE